MVLATYGATRVKGAHTAGDEENVGQTERIASLAAGSALAIYGLRRRGLAGVGMAAVATALVHRGATGRCPVYRTLRVSTADVAPIKRRRRDVTGRAATVNARRSFKIERVVTVDRSADELYRFWRDFSNLPRFMHRLESVTCSDDVHSHWAMRMPGGKTIEWDAEIVNDVAGSLIAWKTVGDPDVAHAGSVHFRPAAGGRGTEVRVVLDYEPPGAALFTQAAKLLGHAPDMLVHEELRRFKQLMETGEIASTEGQTSGR
jgi:uncharacterized membrane protein